MKRNKLNAPKIGQSLASAVTVGVIVALLLGLLLTALLTNLTLNGGLREEGAGIFIFAVRFISVLVGALIAGVILKEKYLPLVGFTALGYLLVLLGIGIVFFDGSFKHFLSGVGSTLLGGVVSILILKSPGARKHKPAKYNR